MSFNVFCSFSVYLSLCEFYHMNYMVLLFISSIDIFNDLEVHCFIVIVWTDEYLRLYRKQEVLLNIYKLTLRFHKCDFFLLDYNSMGGVYTFELIRKI